VAVDNAAAVQVQPEHLCEQADLDALAFEGGGFAMDELLDIVDDPADVVGDASAGVRDVPTALEDDDTEGAITPSHLRGRAHPRGVAADNHQPPS